MLLSPGMSKLSIRTLISTRLAWFYLGRLRLYGMLKSRLLLALDPARFQHLEIECQELAACIMYYKFWREKVLAVELYLGAY